jgi:hypothetical protein
MSSYAKWWAHMFTKCSLLHLVVIVVVWSGLKKDFQTMDLYLQGGRCSSNYDRGSMLLPFY